MKKVNQRIRYLRTSDGIKLAWAEAGSGPVMIKAANWLTHLEYEWESPVWRHWMSFFTEHFRFVRYDVRGSGMSDWNINEISLERWVDDLESVIEAADPDKPFALFGMSQGAAICVAYAVRHPERVSHLILLGGFARGTFLRGHPKRDRLYKAMIDLIRLGWGNDNPAFRQIFASLFIPGATDEQMDWFNDLCRKTTSPDLAARLLETLATVDVSELLEKVAAPTLVFHSRDDAVIPLSEGRFLAAAIPGSQFIELDSRNHVLLDDESAWERFRNEVSEFTGVKMSHDGDDSAFAQLSPREREILALLSEGLGNEQIADRLTISEKTVRNHMSNLFDKLGVWTRAQAIVFARDRGFNG